MTDFAQPIRRPRAAAICALLIATLAVGEAAAQAVGVLAAVNRDVTGERPAEPPRPLILNEQLISNERVTTSDTGGGQVLFLDQTSLTLSPGSDIVLDRYLYNPEQDTGELSVSILKGAMRLVGGRITKTSVATIRTPSATIGIRGGIGNVTVEPDGGTSYIHVAGISSTISNDAGEVTITREGGFATVPGDGEGGEGGGAPTYQGVATPETMAEAFSAGTGEGDGGAALPPTPATVAPRIEPLEVEVSRASGATTEPPISTTGQQQQNQFAAPPPDVSETPDDEIADSNIAQDIADEQTQLLSGLTFSTTWDAVAGLTNGDFAQASGLDMQLEYSLVDGQGIAIVQLPTTGDAFPTITAPDGTQFVGDRFIVVGDEDLALSGDVSVLSQLGGDASDTALIISAEDLLSGSIFIDYADSGLENTAFVDGDVTPVTGERVDAAPIIQRVNSRRE